MLSSRKNINMKRSLHILIFGICLFAAGACSTNNLLDENRKWEYLDSSNAAYIKLIHNFAGNTPQLPTAPNLTTGPQIFLYANGQKLTGNAVGYTGLFPATTVYALAPAGNSVRFDIVMARMNLAVVPNVPAPVAGDTLLTFTQSLQAGKYYSFIMGDSVPNIRVTVNEDQLNAPAAGKYKIRVANWVMNPGDTLSLYSRLQKTEIIQNVAHKNISDWVEVSVPVISDTLELRKKGTTTIYATVNGSTPSFLPTSTRMYTVMARGKTGVTSKGPSATTITNR
jgi:hypothetical protein